MRRFIKNNFGISLMLFSVFIIVFFSFFPLAKVYAATETIRPTDAYNPDGWTNPSYGYDGTTTDSASNQDPNATPSISFGGSSSGESTNAWQSKSHTWTAATLYYWFSKTAGSDDTVEVLVTDQNGNTKHTLISSTAGAVTKTERSQVLNSSDWGGSGFPNIANLRVRVNGTKNKGPDRATSYMYDIRIEGTYTTGITLSGSTNSTGTVAVAVDGTVQSQTGSITGTTWSISSVDVTTGDIVTVWIDGAAETDESTAVAKYDGSGNMTGMVLNKHVLSIGSDDNQSLTVSDLGKYDHDNDEDIMHSANSSTLNVDAGSNYTDEKIDILSGNTLTIASTETLTTHDVAINGTLTATSNATLNVSGSWDNNGTFNCGTSTVTFTATSGSETIDSTGASLATFYNLTLGQTSGTATWTLGSNLDVDGDLTLAYGTLDVSTSNYGINVALDWVNSGSGIFNERSGTVTFDGDGVNSANLNSNCANADTCTNENFYNVVLNKTGADADDNLTLTNNLRITNSLTITDGELIQGGGYNVRVEGSSAVSISANGKWTNTSTGDITLGGSFDNSGVVDFDSNGTGCSGGGGTDDIKILSTVSGTQRSWTGSGTFTMYNLDVSDQGGTASITVYSGTDSGGNGSNWTFSACPLIVTMSQEKTTTDTGNTSVGQGASGVWMGTFGFVTNYATDTITSITITLDGSANPADIVTIFLEEDTDSDRTNGIKSVFGSAACSATTINITGTATISTTKSYIHAVFDFATSATIGNTEGAKIANNSDVTFAGGATSTGAPVSLGTATITAAAKIRQTHYRWRSDTGSETDAAWKAPMDEAVTNQNKNENIRLRFSILDTGQNSSNVNYRLEYATLGGASSCESVPSSNFSVVSTTAGTSPVVMTTSANFADGDPTTNQLYSSWENTSVTGGNLNSLALDTDYVYFAGTESTSGDDNWRIEKRKRFNGNLCTAAECGTAFGTNGVISEDVSSNSDRIYGIAVQGDYLYAVGYDGAPGSADDQWRIEKRRVSDGALCTSAACGTQFGTNGIIQENYSTSYDEANGIAIDSNYIYVAGYVSSSGADWRIEKRDINTGSLVPAFDSDGIIDESISSGSDVAVSIAVDSNYLYIYGYDSAQGGGNTQFRLEKRNKTTGALCTGTTACAEGAFGDSGTGIIQDNITSGLDQPQGGANSIAIDSDYIYLVGYDTAAAGNKEWHIQKRKRTNGNLCTAAECGTQFGTNGRIQEDVLSGKDDSAYGVDVDSDYLYVVGQGADASGWDFRIEKRDIDTGNFVSSFGTNGAVDGNVINNASVTGRCILRSSSSLYVGGRADNALDWQMYKKDIETGSHSYTFSAGKMVEYPSNQTQGISLNADYFTEIEYNFQFTNYAPNGTTFCFRVTKSGTDLSNGYFKIASITTSGTPNVAPSFTAGPSDGGSCLSAPTIAGNNVNFTATASDTEGDNYYLAICKSDAITVHPQAPPTCDDGSWCISSAYSSGSEASCSYATSSTVGGPSNWYGFVCDYNYDPKCSSSSQGSGDNGSPFQVKLTNLMAGDILDFSSTASDVDTDTAVDTISLYVCKANDFTGTACGTGGTWCTSSWVTSNPSCSYTIQVSDAPGTYYFYGSVCDTHGFCSSDNPRAGVFGIGMSLYLTFSISDNSVGFGDLDSATVRYATGDGNGSITEPGSDLPVKLTISTSATNGVVITIKDTNAGLYTSAGGGHTISAVGANGSTQPVAGTEGYAVYGKDASGLTIDEGFDDDATSPVAISTTYQTFATSSAAVDNADVDLALKAAISGTSPKGSYTDTITIIATGKY